MKIQVIAVTLSRCLVRKLGFLVQSPSIGDEISSVKFDNRRTYVDFRMPYFPKISDSGLR